MAAVIVVVVRGTDVEFVGMQLLCVKARRRDATAAILYAGGVVVCVLSRPFPICVIMAMRDTTRVGRIRSCYETPVIEPEYSGAKFDF